MKKVAIIGAGNVGTQFAIMFSSFGCEVRIYSERYKEISNKLELVDENNQSIQSAQISLVSDSLDLCLKNADIVFITTPPNIADDICRKILPFICEGQKLCFVPGYGGIEFAFKHCLENGSAIYALQRVPSVARLVTYGKVVRANKPRPELFISCLGERKDDEFLKLLGDVFDCKVTYLKDFLNITINTSNPILHTSRLFVILKDYTRGKVYKKIPLFYEEWDDESSALLLNLDTELLNICKALEQFDLSGIKSLKEHYGVMNKKELTKKIKGLPGIKGIYNPNIVKKDNGYEPDFNSRYFLADFDYGLDLLVQISKFFSVDVPKMEKVLNWYRLLKTSRKRFDFTNYGVFNKYDFINFYKFYMK